MGDISSKDEAPPENVLFVCKLNPLTDEEDLKILFSAYGKVIGCEIIRDYVTGDSLCFGFIEYADKPSCERAYLKMDNVLIDERRIHVDFSQSTSRYRKNNPPGAKGSRYAHLAQRGQGEGEREDYRPPRGQRGGPSASNPRSRGNRYANQPSRSLTQQYGASSRSYDFVGTATDAPPATSKRLKPDYDDIQPDRKRSKREASPRERESPRHQVSPPRGRGPRYGDSPREREREREKERPRYKESPPRERSAYKETSSRDRERERSRYKESPPKERSSYKETSSRDRERERERPRYKESPPKERSRYKETSSRDRDRERSRYKESPPKERSRYN